MNLVLHGLKTAYLVTRGLVEGPIFLSLVEPLYFTGKRITALNFEGLAIRDLAFTGRGVKELDFNGLAYSEISFAGTMQ
ncbi:MAG: hypothetical protein ACTSRU_16890 [Candidatus Hodarchaeales archaeon]